MTDFARQFHEDGCAVVRGVFSPARVQEVLERIEAFAADRGAGLPPGRIYYEQGGGTLKALHRPELDDPWLEQLQYEPALLELVRAIFPEADVVPTGTAYFAKLAIQGSATPVHQDNVFQHYDPPMALTATIALDGSDERNGPLICLRGSHRLGVLPHRQSEVAGFSQTLINVPPAAEYPEVVLTMEPGDISLHHVNTIHFTHANQSGRNRRQYGLGYRSSLASRNQESYDAYQTMLAGIHKRVPG